MTSVRLFALDVDNTLLYSDKSVSFRVRNALRKAGSQGIIVVLASSRPPAALKRFSALLGERDGCFIANSGTIVLEGRTGEILYERKILPAAALPVFDLADAEGFAVQIHEGDTIYISRANEFTGYGEKYGEKLTSVRQVVLEAANFREMIAAGCHKMLIPGDPMILEPLALLLKTLSEEVAIHSPRPYLLEVLPSGIDKSSALVLAAKKYSVLREEVLVMGNSPDDAAMFRWAGYSATTNNAESQLKEIASYITETANAEDCVAEVIEHFLLGTGAVSKAGPGRGE
jgi:Cof subfamily protein (haloacid dehalogenase superfamily)